MRRIVASVIVEVRSRLSVAHQLRMKVMVCCKKRIRLVHVSLSAISP